MDAGVATPGHTGESMAPAASGVDGAAERVRRRRWQFGLPLVFGLMTLVAVVLAWRGRQIEAQRAAVTAVHKIRGGVFYHPPDESFLGKVEHAWFGGEARPQYITFRYSPTMFEQPARFEEIQPHLKRLGSLRKLSLEGTSIGDEQLPLLEQLTQLDELNVRGTLVSTAGVARLRERLPGCQIMD